MVVHGGVGIHTRGMPWDRNIAAVIKMHNADDSRRVDDRVDDVGSNVMVPMVVHVVIIVKTAIVVSSGITNRDVEIDMIVIRAKVIVGSKWSSGPLPKLGLQNVRA